ncbi:MAG: SprT family zinc-dependent metalloprotease [Dokdonella sp.]
MIEQTLHYGVERIRYGVTFRSGLAHKLAIHVLPDGRVSVEAPVGAGLDEIKRAVAQRARWLTSHLRDVALRRVEVWPREYVSGESHLYLGRRYLLKVRTSLTEDPSVSLRRGRFEVVAKSRDGTLIGGMLWEWYRSRARLLFAETLERMADQLSWVDHVPQWKLVAMKRQWGSCSPSGTLSINPHLIKAPRICIDYVLLHELCHLRIHDHSTRFYRLLTLHMPEWHVIKQRLDSNAERFLAR